MGMFVVVCIIVCSTYLAICFHMSKYDKCYLKQHCNGLSIDYEMCSGISEHKIKGLNCSNCEYYYKNCR